VIHGSHVAVVEPLFGCRRGDAQHRSDELGEEAFDEIEPRAVLGAKVNLKRPAGRSPQRALIPQAGPADSRGILESRA
jgi:hypothetical protein